MPEQEHSRIRRVILLSAFSLIALLGAFGCAMASVLIPPIWIVVLLGLTYTAFCFIHPVAGLCAVLFCQTFDQMLVLVPSATPGDTSFINTLTVPKLMFIAMMAAVLMRQLLTKQESLLKGVRQNSLFLMLIVLFILSLLPGIVLGGGAGGTLVALSRLINCLILCLTVCAIIRSFDDLCLVLCALLPAFVLSGLVGLYETITQTHVLTLMGRPISSDYTNPAEVGYFRVLGPNGEPISYATTLLFGVVCALVVLQLTRRPIIRGFCFFSLALFGFDTVSTGSRGGIASCAVLLGVFFLLGRLRLKWIVAGGSLLACLLGFTLYTVAISATPLKRFTSVNSEDEGTLNRMGFNAQCFEMIEDSPVLGVGLGGFNTLQINTYFDNRTPRRPYYPHNVYLQIPAESGLGALVLYLAVMACCSVPLLHSVLGAREPRIRNTGAALLGGVVGLALFATNTNLREQEYAWLMLSFAMVATHACRTRPVTNSPPPLISRREADAGELGTCAAL